MLFRAPVLDGIRSGAITLAFRRWLRPAVKAGGSILTPIGQLTIEAVTPIEPADITADDARRAGYASVNELSRDLSSRDAGTIYRIELGTLRPDPRVALREGPLDEQAAANLIARLAALDRRSPTGPWTHRTLALIGAHPHVLAARLAERANRPKETFKLNVRKLKNLGLTESLEIGYRLSPRGRQVLDLMGEAVRT